MDTLYMNKYVAVNMRDVGGDLGLWNQVESTTCKVENPYFCDK